MTSGRILLGSLFRRRWRTLVALVVLGSIGLGVGLASLAAARRTASSFGRFLDHVAAYDVNSNQNSPEPGHGSTILDGLDGVTDYSHVFGFIGQAHVDDPTAIRFFIAWTEMPDTIERPFVVDGRLPREYAPYEVMLSESAAEASGLGTGDRFAATVAPPTPQFDPDFERAETFELTVTGVEIEPAEVVRDDASTRQVARMTPAFVEQHGDLALWTNTFFRLDSDADRGVVLARAAEAGLPVSEDRATEHARVQDSIRPLVMALTLLGAMVVLGTLLAVGQGVFRVSDDLRVHARVLAALGVAPRQQRRLESVLAAGVGAAVALGAVAVAVSLSPLAPVGLVRRVDPARGVDVDLIVLIGGAVVTFGALAAAGRLRPARRADDGAVAAPAANWVSAPAASMGIALASGAGRAERRRFWVTIAAAALVVSVAVAGDTFVAGMNRLTSDGTRYGFAWDLAARTNWGEVPPEAIAEQYGDLEGVEAVTAATMSNLSVGGVHTPAMALSHPVGEEQWPPIVRGRAPVADHEIVLGEQTLDDVGVDVGDRVNVSLLGVGDAGERALTVVGTAVFPAISLGGLDPPRLDSGIALGLDGYTALRGSARSPTRSEPEIAFFALADDDVSAVKARGGLPDRAGSPTEWFEELRPAEVVQAESASGYALTAVGILELAAVASIGHVLITRVRRNRRDYALLKALGFTRRQVGTTVGVQATLIVAVALFVGLPVGIATGRWAWTLFARDLGVIDTPVVSVATLGVLAAAAFAVVNLVALVPAMSALRLAPAASLREE